MKSAVQLVTTTPTDEVPAQFSVRLDRALANEIREYRARLVADDLDLTLGATIRRLIKLGLRTERSK